MPTGHNWKASGATDSEHTGGDDGRRETALGESIRLPEGTLDAGRYQYGGVHSQRSYCRSTMEGRRNEILRHSHPRHQECIQHGELGPNHDGTTEDGDTGVSSAHDRQLSER